MQNLAVRSLVLGTFILLSTGCGTARLVNIQPGRGGVVAVNQDSSSSRSKAESMMKEVCRDKKVNIIEEGEVITGMQTSKSRSPEQPTTLKSTSPTTEWRIQFRCID